jgi:hypothetical protein
MTASSIEKELSKLEERLQAVSSAIISGDALDLETRSRQLKDSMASFAQATVGQQISETLAPRLKQVSQTLAFQRENLVRRSVIVDRALASFLPASDTATYSHSVGKTTAGAANAARIYASRAT